MNLPLAFYIGLRYTRAKRRSRFVSFISLASMIGIALGVMVLITVLSVMNGFDEQIRKHFFALTPQVTVYSQGETKIPKIPGVKATASFASGDGVFIKDRELKAITVMGIIPDSEKKISALASKVSSGSLDNLTESSYNLVMSENLALQLNVAVGDTINVYTSQVMTTPLGLFPRYRRFNVAGVYADTNNAYSQAKIFINLKDAETLFAPDYRKTGLHLILNDPFQAPAIAAKIHHQFPELTVENWTQESGAFFQALAMEKTMMFIILALIIAIAAFNLVSSLIMVVNEKMADIAILRTLGAPPQTIRNIFIVQGSIIGWVGMILGLILGILLAMHVSVVAGWIEQVFHVQFIPTGVNYLPNLPSRIRWQDVVEVGLIAFSLSIIATLYPAWVAFRIQPAEALRYE